MVFPESFERKIGFDQVRQMVALRCLSPLGMVHTGLMGMRTRYEEVNDLLIQTAEFKQICVFEEFPSDHYLDVTPTLQKVKLEGRYPELEEVYQLKKSLDTIKAILQFLKTHNEKYPTVARLASDIQYYSYITERIDAFMAKNGRMKDNATSELLKIRGEISASQGQVNKRLESILKKARHDGIADEDATLTIRNGRLVIPINSTHKRKIHGLVQDESATGKTSYIEPAEVVELNNQLKELEYAENREIIRILIRFADEIRPYLADLEVTYMFLGYIDFLRAKALVAIAMEAVMPSLHESCSFRWVRAVHPLLQQALQKSGKQVVPLDIALDEKNRILLISGPNAGGKSVCLKTMGLLQYMLQCGMLAPMSENSEAGIFQALFIDIGDEQSIENDLSTYSSHLVNMKYFLRYASPTTLLLIDEFGSGTEPVLGGAIAEAILEQFNRKGAYGIITTHYANLKHFAACTEGIVNGAMLFDTGQIQPLFKLEIGRPGSSFAIDIARKTGLPNDILQAASEKAGQQHIDIDKHLREIIRDKHYWQEKREEARINGKKLQEALANYTLELNRMKGLEREIKERARQEAKELLSGVNRKIENTIRAIVEGNADKEKTRQSRKEMEHLKANIDNLAVENSDMDQKIEQAVTKAHKLLNDATITETPKKSDNSSIQVGDNVRLVNQDTVGEVLEVTNGSIMVAFGNMVTTVKEARLLKVSRREVKRMGAVKKGNSGLNLGERKLNFNPALDVRGKRAEEAIELIRQLVDEATLVSVRELRILHGKGNGILREVIREYLKTAGVVKTFRDANVEHGGTGITIVEMDI